MLLTHQLFFYNTYPQESELRYLTFLYTCPLSVLYGLEAAGLDGGSKSVKEAEELVIHLVRTKHCVL
jgi:hypothetical protein